MIHIVTQIANLLIALKTKTQWDFKMQISPRSARESRTKPASYQASCSSSQRPKASLSKKLIWSDRIQRNSRWWN